MAGIFANFTSVLESSGSGPVQWLRLTIPTSIEDLRKIDGRTAALLAVVYVAVILSAYFLLGARSGPRENNVRVTQLLVHPIKSCRGTSVKEVRYTANGVENDRKWVIVQKDTHKFITAREHATMVLINPRVLTDATSPTGGVLDVSFPAESGVPSFQVPLNPSVEQLKSWEYITDVGFWSNAQLDGYVVESTSPSPSSPSPSELLSQFLGLPVLLIMKGPIHRHIEPTKVFPNLEGVAQFQDGFPLFLTTMESLADLQGLVAHSAKGEDPKWRIGKMDSEAWRDGGRLRMERFRPNIVVSGASKPFVEDTWAEIVVGPPESASRISLVSKGTRCLLPNVDPENGTRDDAVPYKVMAKFRNVDPDDKHTPCFGINGVPAPGSPSGVLRVGDRVRVSRTLTKKELALVTKQALVSR